MTTRRAIQSVLHNLLGTFTSRYTEYEGYWLFGFVVADLDCRNIDLLGEDEARASQAPWESAVAAARTQFRDQAAKAGVDRRLVRHAELEFVRAPGTARGLVNGAEWDGYHVVFTARATMDDGSRYARTRRVFVSPHSDREMRSAGGDRSGA